MPLHERESQTGAVYVLRRHICDRPVIDKPYTNAERPDTDLFYEDGVYDQYEHLKRRYEKRRAMERRKASLVQEWAMRAVEALDRGWGMPSTSREVLPEVLQVIWDAGATGRTRPEICRLLRRDGGKVSGAMTDLHAAGIIFPLEGVRR